MKLACPECGFEAPEDQVDPVSESVLCPRCDKYFDGKEWIEKKLLAPDYLRQPPAGAWFQGTASAFKTGVSTRYNDWLAPLLIACCLSALLPLFALGFLRLDSRSRRALLAVFAPFCLLLFLRWRDALMSLGGRIEVRIEGSNGTVFRGFGPVGRTQQFDWSKIKKIYLGRIWMRRGSCTTVSIEGEKVIGIAAAFKPERMRFLWAVLKQMKRERVAGSKRPDGARQNPQGRAE